jgi:hypothetical protein
MPRPIAAAIGLTGLAAMPIKDGKRMKGTTGKPVRNFVVTSLILVPRRTAGGG